LHSEIFEVKNEPAFYTSMKAFHVYKLTTQAARQKRVPGEVGISVTPQAVSGTSPSNTTNVMSSQDLYYNSDTSPLPPPATAGVPPPPSLPSTPALWWMTSYTSSLGPSPSTPRGFGTTPETCATTNSSQSDGTFSDLFDPTEAQYGKQSIQNPAALFTYSSELGPTDSQLTAACDALLTNSLYTVPPKAHSPPLSCLPPPNSSSVTASSIGDSPCPNQPIGISGDAQTNAPLLHVAVRTGKKTMVRLLLRRGATTVDEHDAQGRTALHVAVECGDEGMVRLLLKHGADPNANAKDGDRLDILRLAVEYGREEIVETILDAIAQRE
jgi:hypothetical protein